MKRLLRYWFKQWILSIASFLAGPSDIMPLQRGRCWLLKLLGMRIGANTQLSQAFYIHDGRNFSLGDNCRVGAFARVWDFWPIQIGDNLLASHNLSIISGSHYIHDLSNKPGPITIGKNVWIGINVTILGPVNIGDNSIIGAGAMVNKDVPANAIFAGVPAKLIRMRDESTPAHQS